MKKIITLVLLGFMTIQVNAQKLKDTEVPPIVKSTFMKAYPAAKAVIWDKEKNGDFEASFDHNKKDMSVILDENGIIKEVETEIKKSDLPIAIQAALKKDYVDYKIEEVAQILSNGVLTYEVEVERKEKSFDLIFDNNGKLLEKFEKEEDEEKD